MESKTCSKCKNLKTIDEFPWRSKIKQKKQAACRDCTKQTSKKWYKNNTSRQIENVKRNNQIHYKSRIERMFAFLSDKSCIDCGERNPILLDFDHVRGEKVDNISHMLSTGASWTAIEAELEKCEPTCSNCHRLKTAQRGQWYMYELWKLKEQTTL